ncbi:MAG: methyltransferase domain-containing protein [Nitrospirota bacterium]|jgi:SAM-dependent methyltransferase
MKCLGEDDVKGKSVIEIGSLDVNGSLRPTVQALGPNSYVGVDIQMGPGVDIICDAAQLIECFGREKFDVLICSEVMEHVRGWRTAVLNLKNVIKSDGIIILTTRSRGFRYHGYPFDFWRYEIDDIKNIFSDLTIELIEEDPMEPGVFMRARKPAGFVENDTAGYRLYSIITRKRTLDVSERDIALFKFRRFIRGIISGLLPRGLKNIIKKYYLKDN